MKRNYKSKVIKFSGNKTMKVIILFSYIHSMYKKIIKKYRKFLVHNTLSDVKIGDYVLIEECRPISKKKHFYVKKIISNNDTKAYGS